MNARMMGAILALAAILLAAGGAMAVHTEILSVASPGNAGEWSGESYGGYGPDRICGAVDYVYNIGKYEVTNAEYVEFLNAVDPAGADPHDLYNGYMGSGYGGITFTAGNPDGSKYEVRSSRGNKPVNYVSFWDACRFANWLHNGQGSGDTETGAYTLTADGITNNTVTRNPGWQWAVCSEDEWYKAAYYDGGSSVYYVFPTGSDTVPTAEVPPGTDMTNGSANYDMAAGNLTDVGAYTTKPSDSPYGTFDQGGNVWEWNEAIILTSYRGARGGSFFDYGRDLGAAYRHSFGPTYENGTMGFRVSQVPEPASVALLALGGVGMLMRRRGVRG